MTQADDNAMTHGDDNAMTQAMHGYSWHCGVPILSLSPIRGEFVAAVLSIEALIID